MCSPRSLCLHTPRQTNRLIVRHTCLKCRRAHRCTEAVLAGTHPHMHTCSVLCFYTHTPMNELTCVRAVHTQVWVCTHPRPARAHLFTCAGRAHARTHRQAQVGTVGSAVRGCIWSPVTHIFVSLLNPDPWLGWAALSQDGKWRALSLKLELSKALSSQAATPLCHS